MGTNLIQAEGQAFGIGCHTRRLKWNFIVHFSLSAKERQNIRIMLTIFRGGVKYSQEKPEPAGTSRFP